jgi:hypothetical protein
MKVSTEHNIFSDLQGTTTVRPFRKLPGGSPQCSLWPNDASDRGMLELDYHHVRPSHVVAVVGQLSRAAALRTSTELT